MTTDPPGYYNTNGEEDPTLASSESRSRYQERVVLAHFHAYPDQFFGPHEIPMPPGTPLTSTRRAITNLTTRGELEKTPQMVQGTYGKMVHTWRLRRQALDVNTLLQNMLDRHRHRQVP